MTQLMGTIIFIVVFPCLVFSTEIKSALIISIDALHPAALGSKTTKNIHNLMKQGVFTLDPSFPKSCNDQTRLNI
jgi:hypothetical protein